MRISPHPRGQRGLTMIELIMFIVIVSVGLAGILLVVNTVVKSSADPMVRKQSIAMADAILEEVLLKDYPVGGALPLTALPTGRYSTTSTTTNASMAARTQPRSLATR